MQNYCIYVNRNICDNIAFYSIASISLKDLLLFINAFPLLFHFHSDNFSLPVSVVTQGNTSCKVK